MAQPDIITRDHDVLGGTPVFATTRVPMHTLLDYLAAGLPHGWRGQRWACRRPAA